MYTTWSYNQNILTPRAERAARERAVRERAVYARLYRMAREQVTRLLGISRRDFDVAVEARMGADRTPRAWASKAADYANEIAAVFSRPVTQSTDDGEVQIF